MALVTKKRTATGVIDAYALGILRQAPVKEVVITRGDGKHPIPGHDHGTMEIDVRTRIYTERECVQLVRYLREQGVRVVVINDPPHLHLEFYPKRRFTKHD